MNLLNGIVSERPVILYFSGALPVVYHHFSQPGSPKEKFIRIQYLPVSCQFCKSPCFTQLPENRPLLTIPSAIAILAIISFPARSSGNIHKSIFLLFFSAGIPVIIISVGSGCLSVYSSLNKSHPAIISPKDSAVAAAIIRIVVFNVIFVILFSSSMTI